MNRIRQIEKRLKKVHPDNELVNVHIANWDNTICDCDVETVRTYENGVLNITIGDCDCNNESEGE